MDVSRPVYCLRKRLHRSGTERGIGMVILAALIYYFTMWLTGGNELVTGIFMFLAPACGLMIRFMVGYGRR
jgi:hypothetical protein